MNTTPHTFRIMGFCALFIVYKYTLQVFPSAISHVLMSEFSMNGLEIGHLSGVFLYTLVITQLLAGYCLDRYSVVRLIGSAIGLCSFGTIIFSLSRSFYILLIARALMGIGGAFAAAGYFKMTSLIVPDRYVGLVNGLLSTAMTLGIIFGKMLFSSLVPYYSWRVILFELGIAGSVLSIFFLFSLKTAVTRSSQSFSKAASSIGAREIMPIFKSPQNWLISLYNGLIFSPVGVFTGLWGATFLTQAYRLNFEYATLISICIFIGFGTGSPCIGWLADRKYPIKVLMLCNGLMGLLTTFLLIYLPYFSLWVLSILLFLIGFSAGSGILGFMLGKRANTSPADAILVTFLNTGGIVMTSVTEPLIGHLLDLRWSGEWVSEGVRYFNLANYQHSFIVLPIYLISALLLLLFLKEPKNHHKL